MKRHDELTAIFKNVDEDIKVIVAPMIDDMCFLEVTLDCLRKLPFIKVHPTNLELQKVTPASKQYKELLQQYNNCVKILCSVLNKNGVEEESPLRAWLKNLNGDDDEKQ